VLGAVVLLASVPVYVYVEPAWRPLVARLAAGFVLGVTLLQLRRTLVERLARGGASPLEASRARRGPEPGVPHHFLELAGSLRAARRSRHHFEEVLWPRLMALARRPLVRPAGRLGRGPGLAVLGRVLDDIERER
jgi:hypothetical protein